MILKHKWILLLIFLSGLVILILPDKGGPVLKFNKAHGPSFADISGLSLMSVSWIISTMVVIKNRGQLSKKTGSQVLYIMLMIYILSIAGIITGLSLSIEWLLWTNVAVATLINISFIIPAFSETVNKHNAKDVQL